jgi:hypothetical protein
MKLKTTFLMIFMAITTVAAFSQDAIVNEFLQQYSQGRMNEVRTALPDLLVEYPTDPGVKLLLAVVLEDADKSLELYKEIIQKSPDSEWADDAYWRLVQYYAVKNDVEKAEFELANFRKRYPTSDYLITATDVVRTCRSFSSIREKKARLEEKQSQTAGNKLENQSKKEKEVIKDVVKTSGSFYGLQVGVFATEDAAENASSEYADKRLRTSIEEKMVNGKKMYAVVIGNYSSIEAAEAAKQIIQQQCGDCKPVIYQK